MLPWFFCARMHVAAALAFLFLTQAALAQHPTALLPVPKLTPGDGSDVTSRAARGVAWLAVRSRRQRSRLTLIFDNKPHRLFTITGLQSPRTNGWPCPLRKGGQLITIP